MGPDKIYICRSINLIKVELEQVLSISLTRVDQCFLHMIPQQQPMVDNGVNRRCSITIYQSGPPAEFRTYDKPAELPGKHPIWKFDTSNGGQMLGNCQ